MTILEKIMSTIAQLGTTPDEIAAFLEGQGIKGVPESAYNCPVATYLNQIFPENCIGVRTYASALTVDGLHEEIEHPTAVKAFISRFDCGDYRNLRRESFDYGPRKTAP